jgi:hypothetical protein
MKVKLVLVEAGSHQIVLRGLPEAVDMFVRRAKANAQGSKAVCDVEAVVRSVTDEERLWTRFLKAASGVDKRELVHKKYTVWRGQSSMFWPSRPDAREKVAVFPQHHDTVVLQAVSS